jgi:PIN domain
MPSAFVTNIIYIDTSVFEHRQFDLQSHAFSALRDLIKQGDARLLTSAITVGECHKHIKAHVTEASIVRNKLAADGRILKRFKEYAVLFEKPDKDELSGRLIGEFDKYLVDAKAEHLDLEDANITAIVEQYFGERPPFSSGDKKAEFPDAIVLSTLAAWCAENDESVYVITRDKGMQDACTEDLRLYPLTDVTDFLDLVNSRKQEAADRIKGIFRARADSLVGDIGEKFRDLDFGVHDYEAEVEVDSVDDVSFGDPEIIALDDNQATIEVECDITFTADVSYEDPDTGVWDGEDQRMLFMETVRTSVQHTTYVAVEILFEYESLAALADADDVSVSVMSVFRSQTIMLKVRHGYY